MASTATASPSASSASRCAAATRSRAAGSSRARAQASTSHASAACLASSRATVAKSTRSAGSPARSACTPASSAAKLSRTQPSRAFSVAKRSSERARSLERFATENAREGCVRESFAALLAGVQAERAGDPALRVLFATVARDEARHAALAWEVDAWARARLDPAARERVAAAQREALDALGDAVAVEATAGDVLRAAGAPDAALYRACVERFRGRFRPA